jgi:hypothetical protein
MQKARVFVPAQSALRYDLSMGWTIFTAIDLWMGVFLLDMMSTTVPPEKLPRLRAARKVVLTLLAISIVVLLAQIAKRYAWIRR